MAITAGTALLAGASIVGGLAQASASRSAARSQTKAADKQLALQREIYGDQTERFAPFLGAGTNALAAYNYELGLGPRPTFDAEPQGGQGGIAGNVGNVLGNALGGMFTGDFSALQQAGQGQQGTGQPWEYQGISMTPAAQFALGQGRDTIEAGAAARGGLESGATLAGLERLRFGMAAQDRENQLNRLAGMVDTGMGAAGMQATAGNAFAGMASQSLGNIGNAQAAGAIGQGNALSGMMGNLSGVIGYQQMLNRLQQQPAAMGGGQPGWGVW